MDICNRCLTPFKDGEIVYEVRKAIFNEEAGEPLENYSLGYICDPCLTKEWR